MESRFSLSLSFSDGWSIRVSGTVSASLEGAEGKDQVARTSTSDKLVEDVIDRLDLLERPPWDFAFGRTSCTDQDRGEGRGRTDGGGIIAFGGGTEERVLECPLGLVDIGICDEIEDVSVSSPSSKSRGVMD